MRIERLVDASAFWSRLKDDLSRASKSAYIQTFSFEGDRVGAALGRALEKCPAPNRRLLIDGYSLLSHNDRIIPGPAWLARAVQLARPVQPRVSGPLPGCQRGGIREPAAVIAPWAFENEAGFVTVAAWP